MQSQIPKLFNLSPRSLNPGDHSPQGQSASSGEFKFALEKEISVRGKLSPSDVENTVSASQQGITTAAQNLDPNGGAHYKLQGLSSAEAAQPASIISPQHGSPAFELAMAGQKLLSHPNPNMPDLSAFAEGEQITLNVALTDPHAVLKLRLDEAPLSEVSGLNDSLNTGEGGDVALVLPVDGQGIQPNGQPASSIIVSLPQGANLPSHNSGLESGSIFFNQEFGAGANVSLHNTTTTQLQQGSLIRVPANYTQAGPTLALGSTEGIGVKTLAISALDAGEGFKAEVKMSEAGVQILGVNDLASKFRLNSDIGLREGLVASRFAAAQENSVLAAVITEKSTGDTASSFSLTFQQNQPGSIENARMQMPVNISFGRPEWAGQVAERAAMMSLQKIQVAELQLDPPDLGSLHVKVTVNSDQQASVTFVSPHANVRDALDQSIVRLRDLLEQQGLDLVDVNVSDQQQGESSDEEANDNFETAEQPVNDESPPSSTEIVSHYGVDFYA